MHPTHFSAQLKSKYSLFSAFFKTLGCLFLFIALGLLLDSKYVSPYLANCQHWATVVMLIGFGVLYYKSASRIRKLMLFAVIIGFLGEHLFSIALNMYTYRLHNVPLYVPPGHAIVYIAAVYFCKQAAVKRNKQPIELFLTVFILSYSTVFLVLKKDVFGFVMSLLVLLSVKNHPRERLFFLTMYLVVAYLEIIGTHYQCWFWPKTAFDSIPFLSSANPPTGISLFYFLLDLGCLWFYKKTHLLAWKRMKEIRRIKESNLVLIHANAKLQKKNSIF